MSLSPQWLEILKASGWKTAAISAASALLIYANAKKLLPAPLDPWAVEIAEVAFIVCVCLWLAAVISAGVNALKPIKLKIVRLWAIRRATRDIEEAIPQLTLKEREILGYLVQKNQRHFSYTQDGGYASTLIAKRFVTFAGIPGQVFTRFDFPFEVPKHVWAVLLEHKENLVYSHQDGQPYPWAVHWMAR
jgi:hypothetical protein